MNEFNKSPSGSRERASPRQRASTRTDSSKPKRRSKSPEPGFLAGGGEMGALMRAHDWSKTALGPVEGWPQSLRTATSILLNSRYPMFLAWGPELAFIYNDGYRPIFGDKHPQALGQPFARIWSEIWSDISPLVDRALAGEPTFSEDLMLFMNRHGYLEETYFTFSYSPIRDESGGIGGMFCACTETTGQVLAERRLRTLTALAEAAAGAQVRTVDETQTSCLKALELNPEDITFALLYRFEKDSEARLFGSVGGVAGTSAIESIDWQLKTVAAGETHIVSRLGPKAPKSKWSDAVETAVVLPIPRRDLGEVSAALVLGISPRRVFDGNYRLFFERVAGAFATATANAQAFEAERKRAETLAELDRVKTAFFSNVSHEFRTPITLMLGPLEEALRRPSLSERERQELTVVHRNGLRLLKLVNSLLDFSRVEAGRMQAVYHATDLASFTTELASNFRSACEKAGLHLTIDCPPLPEPVYVDRDMWEKIVLNLLSNAFKFTLQGSITVAVRSRDGEAELTVTDTGTGIPEADLPHLFERFHRVAHQQGRSFEGSGIGLALVRELLKLHNGTVVAESIAGEGSTFTARVPFGSAHLPSGQIGGGRTQVSTAIRAQAYVDEALRWLGDEGEASFDAVETGSATAIDTPRQRVLIADDNADMRDYVRRLLQSHWDLEFAGDGESALAAARARKPDLVLTDVMMPKLDGFGLIREIRADPALRDVPVIMLSARAGEEAKIEGLEAGADDYLTKPFSARELVAHIDGNLKLARLRGEAMEAVSASEARLDQAIAIARLGHWDLDLSTGVLTVSDQCKLNFGYGPDEPFGFEELRAAIHPEDRDRQVELVAEAIAKKANFEIEYRALTPAGEQRWIDMRGRYENGAGGPRLVGVSLDTTAPKRAEEALRESETFMRRILESSNDCIKVLSLGGTLEFMSGGGMQVMEIEDFSKFKGACWPDFWSGEEHEKALAAIAEAKAGGFARFQGYAPTAKGNMRYWDVAVSPIAGDDGLPARLLSISRDITIQRQAEEALRESEERHRSLISATSSVVWTAGRNGDFTAPQASWEAYTGQPWSGQADGGWINMVHPNDREKVRASADDALMRRSGYSSTGRLWHAASQSYRWNEARAIPLLTASGTIREWIGTITDIDEQKAAEQRQTVLINELNHRVKNALTTVQSVAAQTFRDTDNTAEARAVFDARLAALARAHDVLTSQNWQGADLRDVVDQALEPFSPARQRLIVEGRSIRLSPKQALAISMALHELATNAAKYGALSNDTGKVRISWSVAPLNGMGELRISWSEEGGPPVDSPKRRGFGSRLIERNLAHDLGGDASIEYRREGVHSIIRSPLEFRAGSFNDVP